MDAAQYDEQSSIAYYNPNNHKTFADSAGKDTSVKDTELKAIEKSKEDFFPAKSIYTDSKEAARECDKHDSPSHTVRRIKTTTKQLQA